MVVLVVLKMFADHTDIQTEIAIHKTTLGKYCSSSSFSIFCKPRFLTYSLNTIILITNMSSYLRKMGVFVLFAITTN